MSQFYLHNREEDKVIDDLKSVYNKFDSLSQDEQQLFYQMIRELAESGNSEIKKIAEKTLWKNGTPPPTPEEFLDYRNGWLDKHFVESVREWVREDFLKILDFEKNYNVISLYGATRCEHEDTEVLMYDLSVKKLKELQIGDELMGIDSQKRIVERIVTGEDELYEVHQNKGADNYLVTEDHVLALEYTNWNTKYGRKCRRAETRLDISVKDYLQKSKTEKHKLKGKKAVLDFPEQELILDPYYLGLWAGDGHSHNSSITTMDQEIKDYLISYAAKEEVAISFENKQGTEAQTVRFRGIKYRDNKLVEKLRSLSLIHNKHIPPIYLRSSREQRLQLLAGLLDSDGHLNHLGSEFEITTKFEQLSKDILLLCRSLGFRASCQKVSKGIKSLNFVGEYFRIHITGDLDSIPCKLPRKQRKNLNIQRIKPSVNFTRTGIKVTHHGRGRFVGLTLSGPDSYYLHSDLTITHNCGKSYLAGLLLLYTIVYLHYMRDVNKFYKMSPNTSLCLYILSYNYKKVYEIYLKPLYNALHRSERFKQVKFQDRVKEEQDIVGLDTIVYSKASLVGHITLASGIQLITGNDDVLSILGANILSAYISEIAFFIQNAGATEESIFQLYTDVRERISATVGNKSPLAFTYLDTSANNVESLIEREILTKLQHDKDDVFFHWLKRWEVKELHEKNFPVWSKTGETFPVCVGDGTRPPKILNEIEILDTPPDLIEHVPIDALGFYERNITKSIRDISGRPTSKESKYFQNPKIIRDMFNNLSLANVESLVIADAGLSPEKLIWDQVKEKFFVQSFDGRYTLKRAPRETRFLGIDLAKSNKGDLAGLALLHPEWSTELRSVVLVYDFVFPIGPGEVGINLQAIEDFVCDLVYTGNVSIMRGFLDTALSAQAQQNLNRRIQRDGGFILSNSVDRDMNDYQGFRSDLYSGTIKAGRNIFLLNNLMCLELKQRGGKEVVDHPIGKVTFAFDGNWETSEAGKNMKDVSDAAVQARSAYKSVNVLPSTIYEEENQRLSKSEKQNEQTVKKAFTLIGRL